jgi:polysaccharide export outer membrane protein
MFGTPVAKYISGYIISDSGTVNLPIIGKVMLAGLNLEDAEARVKIKANEYLKDPTIQVKFLNYKINIIGEVKVPGIYYNYEGSISIFDAISMARGIADYADLENVTIKRYSGDMIYAHKVNLTDNSIYSTKFYYLQPNDVVYIPPSKLKRRRENATTYSQLLSTVSIIVFGFLGLYGIFNDN